MSMIEDVSTDKKPKVEEEEEEKEKEEEKEESAEEKADDRKVSVPPKISIKGNEACNMWRIDGGWCRESYMTPEEILECRRKGLPFYAREYVEQHFPVPRCVDIEASEKDERDRLAEVHEEAAKQREAAVNQAAQHHGSRTNKKRRRS